MLAGGDDGIGDVRGKEALELPEALQLGHLFGDALFELQVPFLERLGLAPDLVLQRFHPQQRAHAREQLGLVDRLGQEIVGAGLDAMHALLRRIERGDEHHRQQRGRGVGADAPADVVAGQARHHDVEQHQVRPFRRHLGQRFLAVGGGRHGVALDDQAGRQAA